MRARLFQHPLFSINPAFILKMNLNLPDAVGDSVSPQIGSGAARLVQKRHDDQSHEGCGNHGSKDDF